MRPVGAWARRRRASGVGGGANRRRSRRQLTAASRVQGLGPSRSLGREGWQWRAAQHVVARRDPRDGLAGADGERGDATEAARGDVALEPPTDDVRARGSGCGRARWRRGWRQRWRQRWRRGRGWGRGWRRGWRGRGRHGRARDSPRARAAAVQLVVAVAHGAPRSTEEIAAAVGVGAHGACRFWGRRRRRRRGRRRRRRGRLRPGWRAGRQRRRAGRWVGTVGCDLRPENVLLAELDPAVGAGGAGGVRVADGAAQVLRDRSSTGDTSETSTIGVRLRGAARVILWVGQRGLAQATPWRGRCRAARRCRRRARRCRWRTAACRPCGWRT